MTGPVVRVEITATRGSSPRGPGAAMLIWADAQQGSIGGGVLEYRATAQARAMLTDGPAYLHQTIPLGPALGQCCGGAVTLAFARASSVDALPPPVIAPPAAQPVWIFGAGHIGRALCQLLGPMPGFAVTWIDIAADRFPDTIPDGVLPRLAQHPAHLLPQAPSHAWHLILTHDHGLDLAICDAVLRHGFGWAGVIGSASKWARFRTRLRQAGHADAQISRIACPIGDPRLGKHPQAIAVSVTHSLVLRQMTNNTAGTPARDRLSSAR